MEIKVGDLVIAEISPNRIYKVRSISKDGRDLNLDLVWSLNAETEDTIYRGRRFKYRILTKEILAKAILNLNEILEFFNGKENN